jgi:hypothetical protein
LTAVGDPFCMKHASSPRPASADDAVAVRNESRLGPLLLPSAVQQDHRSAATTGWQPYRVTRSHRRGPRLTKPQQAILAALVHECPRPGDETLARAVADATKIRLGSVVVSLRNLARARLVVEHAAEIEGDEPTFAPSLIGRAAVTNRRPE